MPAGPKALWQGCLSGLPELTLQDELQLPFKSWCATGCIPTCGRRQCHSALLCTASAYAVQLVLDPENILTRHWLEVASLVDAVQAWGPPAMADACGPHHALEGPDRLEEKRQIYQLTSHTVTTGCAGA